MSNPFWKIFNLCFTNLQSMEESSILFPSSPPLKQQHRETILKNFNNSLYDLSSSSSSTSKSLFTASARTTTGADEDFRSSDSDSDVDSSPPDFATILSSQRFFFSSPGRSNSIIESSSPSPDHTIPEAETEAETETKAPPAPPVEGGVAVKKYSPDPYKDFRVSMQEMIEARNLTDVNKDWDFLHQLLLCYLNLNPKNTHKFILSAFSDIVVCLLSSSSPESDRR